MTIEEKAKEIFVAQEYTECENVNDEMWMKRDAFGRGAKWMLSQVEDWFKNQPTVQYSAWGRLAQDIFIEFKKTMVE